MSLFSDLSGIDVDACIAHAIQSSKLTPPSLLDHLYFANAGVTSKVRVIRIGGRERIELTRPK